MSEILLKNPGDSIDFTIDWTNLGTANLSTVVHSLPAGSGLTIVSESSSPGDTPYPSSTVRLSGATHGGVYQIIGTATLTNGRTLVRTFTLRIHNH